MQSPATLSYRRPLIFAAVAICYLALSYITTHHWDEALYLYAALQFSPAEIVAYEEQLSATTLFNPGFFSLKIGFFAFLDALVGLLGPGLGSLLTIQMLFAALNLFTGWMTYRVLRLILTEAEAAGGALIFLLMPVTLYLGFKPLAESLTMALVVGGTWAFLVGMRAAPRPMLAWFGLAALLLALAVTTRFVMVSAFVGLVGGLLLVTWPDRAAALRLGMRAAGVLAVAGALGALLIELAGVPLLRIFAPLGYVIEMQKIDNVVRLFALGMVFQLFAPFFALGLLPRWGRAARIALVWAAVAALPFVAGHEPRYYFGGMIPIAVLVWIGLNRAVGWVREGRRTAAWVGLALALAVVNRALFIPLMNYEIDQTALVQTMDALRAESPDATYLIPWHSDYSFLRFAYPDADFRFVLTILGEINEGLYRWADAEQFAPDVAALADAPQPWYLIGWDYNPAILNLRAIIHPFGIDYLRDLEASGLTDHLEASWVWDDPALQRAPWGRFGPYQVFRVSPS